MSKEEIEDLARIYANQCAFKSDYPHDWQSSFDGFVQGMTMAVTDFIA